MTINKLWKMILDEGHQIKFRIYPSMTKMYHDLKKSFWWPGMKKDVVKHVLS